MAQSQLLFAGTWHNIVGGDWVAPSSVGGASGGDGDADGTGCFFSGLKGCVIEHVYYIARDLTFTPESDVHIGLRIRGEPNSMSITAPEDCPQIWDDTAGDNGDFALNIPVKAFTFVGEGTGGLNALNRIGPIVVQAHKHVMIWIAPVGASGFITLPDATLDSFDVLVYGYFKG